MKSSQPEAAAVAAAVAKAEATSAAAKNAKKLATPSSMSNGRTAAERRRKKELATNLWHQTTKIVVPAWFGNCGVKQGFVLGETFTAAGLLALVCVGRAKTESDASTGYGASEVSMQIALRPSGFDRQEAREMAELGFIELHVHKLIKQVKKTTNGFDCYGLTKKGQKWFDTIERSAGCAKTADAKE